MNENITDSIHHVMCFVVDVFTDKFHVHDVPADGNCLFSAIACGLGTTHTAESVRRDVVGYVKDHLEEVY